MRTNTRSSYLLLRPGRRRSWTRCDTRVETWSTSASHSHFVFCCDPHHPPSIHPLVSLGSLLSSAAPSEHRSEGAHLYPSYQHVCCMLYAVKEPLEAYVYAYVYGGIFGLFLSRPPLLLPLSLSFYCSSSSVPIAILSVSSCLHPLAAAPRQAKCPSAAPMLQLPLCLAANEMPRREVRVCVRAAASLLGNSIRIASGDGGRSGRYSSKSSDFLLAR